MEIKNKKGQGLPLNTVILAILVIIVLVIVIAFFLTGAGTSFQKVKDVFGFGLRGTDLSTARLNCQNYCDQAKDLPEDQQKSSAYCRTYFKIDLDNNGNVDTFAVQDKKGEPVHYYCGSQAQRGNDDDELKHESKTVGIDCYNVVCA